MTTRRTYASAWLAAATLWHLQPAAAESPSPATASSTHGIQERAAGKHAAGATAEHGTSGPGAGDDPTKIDAYLSGLADEVEALTEPYWQMRRNGSEEELATLEKRIEEAEWRYDQERARLWPGETENSSTGMIVGGSVLVGLGVLTGVLGGYFASCDGGLIDVGAVLGVPLLFLSGGSLAAGIPLIVIGNQQVPREPSGRASGPGSVIVRAGPTGVALTSAF